MIDGAVLISPAQAESSLDQPCLPTTRIVQSASRPRPRLTSIARASTYLSTASPGPYSKLGNTSSALTSEVRNTAPDSRYEAQRLRYILCTQAPRPPSHSYKSASTTLPKPPFRTSKPREHQRPRIHIHTSIASPLRPLCAPLEP